ncbi:MAG: LamG domain-containing protein [Armatimonadetes bacterium]|nr:LamG domain-containing protein [Armatimonadota bacterium]
MSAMTVLFATAALAGATPVMRLDFAEPGPHIADVAGAFPALLHASQWRRADGPVPESAAVVLAEGEYIELQEARVLLGDEAPVGSLCLWVRPDFDPTSLPGGIWEGWAVIVWLQKKSGNGLPDGYNEIGLALHGPRLLAKAAGPETPAPFADIACPLEQGRWTHLAITWAPTRRCLYVDGALVSKIEGAFNAPQLDDFPGCIGCHPPTRHWFFAGAFADVRLYKEELSHEEIRAIASP